ncbi:hypothetical protein RIF29_43353 [Crotalaria pallida]|uniref:Uncharacterized protein n=1 Tax=Crotalaria pallida TaxID=3830 RepID=A0AAN9HMM3_CROPI
MGGRGSTVLSILLAGLLESNQSPVVGSWKRTSSNPVKSFISRNRASPPSFGMCWKFVCDARPAYLFGRCYEMFNPSLRQSCWQRKRSLASLIEQLPNRIELLIKKTSRFQAKSRSHSQVGRSPLIGSGSAGKGGQGYQPILSSFFAAIDEIGIGLVPILLEKPSFCPFGLSIPKSNLNPDI